MLKKIMVLFAVPCLFAAVPAERAAEYRLQCNDVLEIHYRYTPELDQELTVRPDGRVTILEVGDVAVQGRSLPELTQELTKLATKRLKDPVITVVVKEFQKPVIYVGGEVGTPGRLELKSELSAMEAISMAGGFKNSAKHSQVLLLRRVSDEIAETKVLDLKKLISDKKLEEDTVLRPGDILYVPQNGLSKVERFVKWGNFGMLYSPIR